MNQLIPSTTSSTSVLKAPVEHVTPEQKEILKDAVDKWASQHRWSERVSWIADRDKLLIEWLWQTGMRISDAIAIKFSDINQSTETVRFIVHKRSRKKTFIHEITLSKALMFEVFRYRDKWQMTDLIFPIRRSAFDTRLKLYCEIAGIPKLSAHKFRHGCAMNLLRQGIPPYEIAFRLAHSSVVVTEQVYARMDYKIEKNMIDGVAW